MHYMLEIASIIINQTRDFAFLKIAIEKLMIGGISKKMGRKKTLATKILFMAVIFTIWLFCTETASKIYVLADDNDTKSALQESEEEVVESDENTENQSDDPRIKEILEWLKENEPDKKWKIRAYIDDEGKIEAYYADQVIDEGEDMPEKSVSIMFPAEKETSMKEETSGEKVPGEEVVSEIEEEGEIKYGDINSPPLPANQREAILALFEQKIMFGYNNAFYGPFDNVTRQDVITALWRAAGAPETDDSTIPFKDADSINRTDRRRAIQWACEAGITKGFTDGTFRPDAYCTRGQLITFLWRYEGSPAVKTTKSPFKDVNSKTSFYKQILWAQENGIAAGFIDKTFKPGRYCNRAQCATFIYRMLNM